MIPLCFCCLAHTAQQDTADFEPSPLSPKSEVLAYWAAGGGTALGIPLAALGFKMIAGGDRLGFSMVGLGLIFGSSAGQYYCGSYHEGNLGIAGRAAGLAMITFGYLGAEHSSPANGSPNSIFSVFMIAGLDIFVASTIYSFMDTRAACERANQSGEENRPPSKDYGVEPSLQLSQSGTLQPGVNAWVHF